MVRPRCATTCENSPCKSQRQWHACSSMTESAGTVLQVRAASETGEGVGGAQKAR
jgi:hypothetical protein